MKTIISTLNKFILAIAMALLMVACGSGGGGSSGGGGGAVSSGSAAPASSGMTLRLTDAKVNSLEEVWVTFTEVTFQPSDGRDRFTHVFDEPITVERT